MKKIMLFEVCCGSVDDAYEAFLGGANRIELNSALFMGGLTPSLAELIKTKELVNIPVMAMLRPREGGFCYTDNEYETMLMDADILLENGADGLVFGFLNSDGTVDERRTRELTDKCNDYGRESIFSRAIDVCPDIIEGTKILDKIGLTRVLTSGGKATAIEGIQNIKTMMAISERMEILPGAGIRKENVLELLWATGVKQFHASARKLYYDTSVNNNKEIFFGGKIDGKFNPENEYKITDREEIKQIMNTIKTLDNDHR